MKLGSYNNDEYNPGKSFLVRTVWYFVNTIFFNSYWFPFFGLKSFLLRVFGARIGENVAVKPKVNIKYPWYLFIEDDVWIGEEVWIDNLCQVTIASNVCISQGAMLLTGNHNYKKSSFDLITGSIELKEGVWIGAKSVVCPGVTCHKFSILSVGSVATSDLEEGFVYQGNPAAKKKKRISDG